MAVHYGLRQKVCVAKPPTSVGTINQIKKNMKTSLVLKHLMNEGINLEYMNTIAMSNYEDIEPARISDLVGWGEVFIGKLEVGKEYIYFFSDTIQSAINNETPDMMWCLEDGRMVSFYSLD